MDKRRVMYRILSAIAFSFLLLGSLGVAQPRAATPPAPAVAITTAPAPNERDVAATQTELIRLLRLSPTLTTVVSHDPSLLSNTDYVAHNNPQLAAFLTTHPEVARNPEFYLFSHLKHEDGQPDEALQREVWPDVYRSQGQMTSFERIWSDLVPLLAFENGSVSFRWRDYAHGGKKKVMIVSAHEFLRRFLLHVLPRGLVRIRHFGLFANRRRGASLERCRVLLGATACVGPTEPPSLRCPACSGIMLVAERLTRGQLYFHPSLIQPQPRRCSVDSS